MKKHLSTKILSLLLALIMVAAPVLTVSAAAKEKKAVQNFPLIDVHGFFSSTIYETKNDPDSKEICPWPTDDILNTVKDCVPALLSFAVTKDYDALGDAIIPAVKDLFEPSFCDPDGGISNGSGVNFKYPDASKITKNSELSFKYDWRLDPFVIADQLNDYIDYVLEASGCDKVALTCHSLGGIIALTYLTVYGDSKIYGIAFNTTAIYGETYTGQLFSGDINVMADALINFLKYVVEYNDYQELLNSILDILEAAGLADLIADLGNEIVENLLIRCIPEVLVPLFCCWLPLWAMCPDEYMDDALNFMFEYADPSVDYSELQLKINRYNKEVRAHKEETLKKFNDDARMVVISRYGFPSIPLTEDWRTLSDGVVDTARSSFGATTAPYGQPFDNDYLAKVDPEFISPDRMVDASTCLFPEQTWYIRGYKHASTDDGLEKMIWDLLFYPKKEATVETYENYPRFVKYIPENDGIVPDDNVSKKSNLFTEFIRHIVEFFEKIINFFYKFGK